MASTKEEVYIPGLELQKTIVSILISRELKPGDMWYLIDSQWFRKWKKYIGYFSSNNPMLIQNKHTQNSSPQPGPVDNSSLINKRTNKLKENLVADMHYVTVPEDVWELLVSWFGIKDGQYPISRKVVEFGMFVKYMKVEVYPVTLKLYKHEEKEKDDYYVMHDFSHGENISDIEATVRRLFNIPKKTALRLWNNIYGELNDGDVTVEGVGLYSGAVVTVETQNKQGVWSGKRPKTWKSVRFVVK